MFDGLAETKVASGAGKGAGDNVPGNLRHERDTDGAHSSVGKVIKGGEAPRQSKCWLIRRCARDTERQVGSDGRHATSQPSHRYTHAPTVIAGSSFGIWNPPRSEASSPALLPAP